PGRAQAGVWTWGPLGGTQVEKAPACGTDAVAPRGGGSAVPGRRRRGRRHLPAAGTAFVLLPEPLLQRREVLEHRRGIHGLAAGQLLQRLLPRLAGALGQHRPELLARGLVAGEGALVQRALVAGRVAQRLVELELQHVPQEVAGVGGIARHVVLGARVEELLAAR